MIRVVSGVFAVAALLVGLSAAAVGAQASVSGVWEITVDTQTGEHVWTATFEQDGTTVEGEIDMNDGEGTLPLTGSLEGNAFRWRFVVPDPDGDMPVNLSGEVEGSTMNGDEGSFVWYGTGAWTAAKQ